MSRSKFGWDLPPGVTNAMIDQLSNDNPCEVCGLWVDPGPGHGPGCACPECPHCKEVGSPLCTLNGGKGCKHERG